MFGEEDDELQHAVVRLLKRRDLTLATVDWGTDGLTARWLSEVADVRDYYLGGVNLTHERTALRRLNAAAELLSGDDACRSETTRLLAESIRAEFGSDFGLAIGPAPSIAGGSEPGRICFALADRDGTTVKSASYAGHSAVVKPRAAKQALDLLRLKLSSLPER